ncbi:M23 family metallopeptidase [Candidatus Peregrinibacteria bacterium]|jgi:murein DD-endopeptidase MepM/ murein hydrolase activator NlpD|nr:M23 family metallopeptidase [Candidatus Peregrinibacteria bacterium]MBT4056203.1 M23 family metallopeptidase [Candidatus Peregrinibacteria bacterium]
MTTDTNVYQIDQVNKLAKRQRHFRVFSKGSIVKRVFLKPYNWLKTSFNSFKALPVFNFRILPVVPQKRLFLQSIILSIFLFLLSAVSPINNFSTMSMSYATDYLNAYALPGDILIADSDGYLMKINPQTGNASRIGMTDYAIHTVETGENLSSIAVRFDLSVETIMWENNIGNANTIREGQKLVIPPVDGISYTIAKGDTLEKLAKKFEIEIDAIVAQNNLASNELSIDQALFLPGAKPIIKPTYIATGTSRSVPLANSSSAPVGNKPFLYPTRGSITQGYRAGHYAIDIADTSKPPIWAAGGGTVIEAFTNGWGGGYGNHVIIDHGGGLQTLYAHLDHLTVSEGQWVEQGEVIGQMGNTGRVYGATGIHLHWEVIKNGVKQYPGNYY